MEEENLQEVLIVLRMVVVESILDDRMTVFNSNEIAEDRKEVILKELGKDTVDDFLA